MCLSARHVTPLVQAVHTFFKQGGPLPRLATTTVTNTGVSDYGGKPMSVIKVSYEGRGQKRKRDDVAGRGGRESRGAGRGGNGARGSERGGQWGREWPGGSKKYCRFALGKSNMDTQVTHLASMRLISLPTLPPSPTLFPWPLLLALRPCCSPGASAQYPLAAPTSQQLACQLLCPTNSPLCLAAAALPNLPRPWALQPSACNAAAPAVLSFSSIPMWIPTHSTSLLHHSTIATHTSPFQHADV